MVIAQIIPTHIANEVHFSPIFTNVGNGERFNFEQTAPIGTLFRTGAPYKENLQAAVQFKYCIHDVDNNAFVAAHAGNGFQLPRRLQIVLVVSDFNSHSLLIYAKILKRHRTQTFRKIIVKMKKFDK